MERIRVGIIGTSWWADMMYLPSLKAHLGAQLAAVCGRNRQRAEEMAAKYDIPAIFSDYRRMIEEANLDATIVVTPDNVHYPMTMTALEAGLHVLCEKSLALNAIQAREMYEKAEAAGVKHLVLFTWRWLPQWQHARTLIEEGYVGPVYQCRVYSYGNHGRDGTYQWRFDGRRSNGVLADLGSHLFDLARLCVGDIARVNAQSHTFITRRDESGQAVEPVNDAAQVMLEFSNGAQGIMQMSALAHIGQRGFESGFTLHGRDGTLEASVDFVNGPCLRGGRHDEAAITEIDVPDSIWGDVDRSQPFDHQFGPLFSKRSAGPRSFIDAILQDQPAEPSFYDGWKAQQIVDAALESQQRGCWVALS